MHPSATGANMYIYTFHFLEKGESSGGFRPSEKGGGGGGDVYEVNLRYLRQ